MLVLKILLENVETDGESDVFKSVYCKAIGLHIVNENDGPTGLVMNNICCPFIYCTRAL